MPFNKQEQAIIDYGKKNGKSRDEVERAIVNLRTGVKTKTATPAPSSSLPTSNITPAIPYTKRVTDAVGQDIADRTQRVGDILARPEAPKPKSNVVLPKGLQTPTDPSLVQANIPSLKKDVQVFGQGAGLAANAIEKTVGEIPGIKQAAHAASEGINWLATSDLSPIKHIGDVIGSSKTLQEITKLYDTDQDFKDSVDAVANTVRLGGDVDAIVSSANFAANVTEKLVGKFKNTPKNISSAASGFEEGGTTANTVKMHDNLIKSGDYAPQKVYSDLNARIYHPEVAKQIVSDGVNNLKLHGLTDLAQKYEKMFGDYTKVTPDDVLSNGKLVMKEARTSGLPSRAPEEALGAATKTGEGTSAIAKSVAKDILPAADRVVNHQVVRALDLTQGDVKNIRLSTGKEVGEFVAEKNLIGNNKAETLKNIQEYYKKNYNDVRSEIKKVTKEYATGEIPRYTEALTEIQKQIKDVPGLEKANKEIVDLLAKKNASLEDVQRVKELMDDHFSLYKVTGDVKEGVTKTGLSNIRKDIKKFIEKEVKDNTGADIEGLNNNVAASRSIADAIETRSTRGLTRSNLKLGDLGIFAFGSAAGTPLFGAALVLGKKILESATFRLRMAKFLDGLSDAKKIQIAKELVAGKVPAELEAVK